MPVHVFGLGLCLLAICLPAACADAPLVHTLDAIVGVNADPDGDGPDNVAEQALGLDPTTPNEAGRCA